MKRLRIGNQVYDFNSNVRAGASAMFARKDWKDNPHKDATQASDEWDAGWHAAKYGYVSDAMEIIKGEVK